MHDAARAPLRAMTLRTLAFAQDERADEDLWAAMGALQEREVLLRAVGIR